MQRPTFATEGGADYLVNRGDVYLIGAYFDYKGKSGKFTVPSRLALLLLVRFSLLPHKLWCYAIILIKVLILKGFGIPRKGAA